MADHDSGPAAAQGDAAVATLARRVAALEQVVAIERRLRRNREQGGPARAAAPPREPADATVLHRPPADPDATVLLRARAPEPAPAALLLLAPGCQLLEYRIDAVLGQGGFGVTYLASDVHLGLKVAIKEYLPAGYAWRAGDQSVAPRWPEDAAFYQSGLDSFLVEARTLATFRHPNIVRVARFFEANRTAYMVLEYEHGKSLANWWPGRRPLAEADLLSLLRPLFDGLAVVHAAGYLHRDIKPDNIYVRRDDGSLVLLDFGAARQVLGAAGAGGEAVTPGYAPPEQYGEGGQGPWTDIYALGATLYWMVTGVKPPASPARRAGQQTMAPALQAGAGRYSPAFLAAIDWALAPEPAARPPDLPAFTAALYGAHAASLSLQQALSAGELAASGAEGLRLLRESPRQLQRGGRRLRRALARPRSWPLAVKMTLALLAAALLPMLLTALYNLNGSVAAVAAGESRNLQRMAQSSAGRVAQLIADKQSLAAYIASDPDFIAYLQQPDGARRKLLQDKLASLVATHADVHLMFLMDRQGNALVSSAPGVVGNNYRFREYFREASAGRPFKTSIVLGQTDGKRGMYYANPLRDGSGAVSGVLVLRIKADSFSRIFEQITADTGRVAFMVDGDGILIYYPDARLLSRSLAPLPAATAQRLAADHRFGPARIDNLHMPELARALAGAAAGPAPRTGQIRYRSTLSGQDEHAGYAAVPGHDWVVGLSETDAVFAAPLRQLFANVLASVALVGLVCLGLAALFARSIVRPIGRLTEAANALKDGDYGRAHIEVGSDDEIGRLARTFNVMIDVLRQRERERRGAAPFED